MCIDQRAISSVMKAKIWKKNFLKMYRRKIRTGCTVSSKRSWPIQQNRWSQPREVNYHYDQAGSIRRRQQGILPGLSGGIRFRPYRALRGWTWWKRHPNVSLWVRSVRQPGRRHTGNDLRMGAYVAITIFYVPS